MTYYMNDPGQKFCYDKIKDKHSLENDVDNFWLNLLPDYFQKKLGYVIAAEARPLPQVTKQRADWTIRFIKNGDPKKVILMEDKRKAKETQTSEWREALDQLTRYMTLVRAETGQDSSQTLYGAVNIGTYTRIYQLEEDDMECVDYPGTNGRALELKTDELEIHKILEELVAKTSH